MTNQTPGNSSVNKDLNSKKDDTLSEIGAFIKKARIEKNFSLEEIATSLKIGKEQLKALEEGEQELLPEPVFIKGMIQRVGEKLNIDCEAFVQENSKSKNTGSTEVNSNESRNKNLLNFKGRLLKYFPSISILLGIAIAIPIALYHFNKSPKLWNMFGIFLYVWVYFNMFGIVWVFFISYYF